MTNRKLHVALAALLLLVSLSGCFGVKRSFKSMRNNILHSIDADFKKDIEFRISPLMFDVASTIVNKSDADQEAKDMISKMSNIQIGIYKVRYMERNNLLDDMFLKISRKMESAEWYNIVRSRENNEYTGIFLRNNNNLQMRKMFVIHLDNKELVMIELTGELDDVLTLAMKQHNGKMFSTSNFKNKY